MKKTVLFLFIFLVTVKINAQWIQTAGPFGTNIISLTAKNTSTFYAGSFGAGFFRSINGGNTWIPSNAGLTDENSKYVWSIYSSGNNVYAGTQRGVYKSTDNGLNWTASNTGMENEIVFSIISVNNNLFAGASGGIYRSTNSGATWSAAGLAGNYINSLTWFNNILFAGAINGLFKSTDLGSSWSASDNGIPLQSNITSFAVFNSRLYSGTAAGIYYTSNSGANWQQQNSGITQDQFYINSLSADGNLLYTIAADGIYRITSPSGPWIKVFDEPFDGNLQKLLAVNGMILCSMRSGIMNSDNKGKTWYSVNKGFGNLSPAALTATSNKIYAAGTLDGSGFGVFLSKDDGSDWLDISHGVGSTVLSISASGNKVFAGTRSTGLYRSTNSGTNWVQMGDFTRVLSLSISSEDDNIIFAGTGNTHGRPSGSIYKSVDNGATWTDLSTGLFNQPVLTIETKGANVFVGTSSGLYRSTDKGITWAVNYSASGVLSVRKSDNRLYAITSGGKVILSNNNGSSWLEKNSGITDSTLTALSPIYGDYAYVGSPSGVFYTANAGDKWIKLNSGFTTNTNVISLISNDSYVYAGLTGGRVWRKNQVGAADKNYLAEANNNNAIVPYKFVLAQNYPNPFNPSTVISYTLPKSGLVQLTIYDAEGKEIQTLENEFKEAGSYNVSFDASRLASGVYFYALRTNGISDTKKMLLIK